MDLDTLDVVFIQACCYYVNQQISGRRYPDSSVMVTLSYNNEGHLIILDWLVSDITQPTIEILQGYNEVDVNEFYYIHYTLPAELEESMDYLLLTSAEIGVIPEDTLVGLESVIVYNLTTHCYQFWNGSSWFNM